ncbi:MAG: DUF1294 domain-containing protein [Verrucomicrobia bacterium]|nr:DUF1294 domain-containing protein [Verrucomicrobiota bacterium]
MTRFGWTVMLAFAGGAIAIAVALAASGVSPLWSLAGGVNLATTLAYGYDKFLARARLRRVPELALHLMALCAATPGAFVGQVFFRHKTRDRTFRLVFLAIAALHVGVGVVVGLGLRRYG